MKPIRIRVRIGDLEGHVYVQDNQIVGVTGKLESWLWRRWSTMVMLVKRQGGEVEIAR